MKIFDCFLFYNELEILELKLDTMYESVDYFVIGESNKTFSGKSKRLYFDDNKKRFEKFQNKIIYVKILDSPDPIFKSWCWNVEFFQRDALMRGIHKYASKGDLIIASDVDEIINPKIFQTIKLSQSPLSVELDLYYYYLNMKANKKGLGPVIGIYGSFRGIEQLRLTVLDNKIISSAGWHFTFMGGAEKIINKLNAYSESQTNRTILNDQASISYIINNRIDLFNRDGYEYKIVEIGNSYPKNIQNFIDKYPNYIYDSSNMPQQPNHSVPSPINNINEDLTKRNFLSKVLKRLYKIYWKYIK